MASVNVKPISCSTKSQQFPDEHENFLRYAEYLGVDPANDFDLLWIVNEAWNAPLPSGWTEHVGPNGHVFYYNSDTDSSQWLHPLDEVYREHIARSRTHDDKILRSADKGLTNTHGSIFQRFVCMPFQDIVRQGQCRCGPVLRHSLGQSLHGSTTTHTRHSQTLLTLRTLCQT
mmetsp:Transcript_28526/g.46232  ORF Transcript_28526/g.46232 Transcript_28526/m.46232 type:complete len:173 (+) Transcript_28526:124-642(+)